MRRALITRLLAALSGLVPVLAVVPAEAETWVFESEHVLPSSVTGWGGIMLEASGPGQPGRLFAARHADGLLAWDRKAGRGATVANSVGANDVVLAPDEGRGYAAMSDGSVLVFDLKTLQPISRADLGAGPLRTGFYEPTRKRVYMINTPREAGTGADRTALKTTWITLDAATGAVLGKTEFSSEAMDRPATDGTGLIYAPLRDKALLQQMDAADLAVKKTWKLGDCEQPAATLWDAAAQRVLVACRGAKPVFVALDPATGVVATIPIGGGVNGIAFDPARHLVVTANGEDGTMSVIRQTAPDTYALVETIATRPMARGVQFDPANGELFTVSASFTRPAPGPDGKARPPEYHPDSFTILALKPVP